MDFFKYSTALLFLFISTTSKGQGGILLAKVCNDTKCGFIDTLGNYKIEPKFEDVRDFSEGLAAVKHKSKWGFIDTSGNFIIDPVFTIVRNFNNGRAKVFIDNDWFFIDKKGGMKISGYGAITDFNGGYAAVRKNSKWGIIDTSGKIIVPIVYNHMKMPVEGKAIIKEAGKYGFINLKNELIIKNKYGQIDQYSEGIAKVWSDEGIGFIDTAGNWIFKIEKKENTATTYDVAFNISYFKEGRVFIRGSYYNTYAIFDSIGNKLTSFKYYGFRPFSEGLAAVEINNSKWGYVDKKGLVITEPIYSDAGDFSYGYAAVLFSTKQLLSLYSKNIYLSKKWGFINKKGEIKILPKFDLCTRFYDPFLTFPDKFE